jgi:hypothetical protein
MSGAAELDGVEVRAAVAVADGSLTGAERARAEARLAATPAGRRALAQQQRVVHALRAGGPVPPPTLRAAVHAQSAGQAPSSSARLIRPAMAGCVIATLLAVAALVLGRPDQQPTMAAALELGMRPATESAPPPLASHPTLLLRSVDGVAFPNWALARGIAPPGMPRTGWRPVGARHDKIGGRHAETVYYQHMDHRVAYTIIAGDALKPPTHARTTVIAGRTLWEFRDGNRDVVVFTREGRTCVLAGHVISPHTLERLATWRGSVT